MADSYFALTIDVPEGDAELLQNLCHESGATGLEVRDGEAPPMPGVRGPNRGEAIVVAYFQSRAEAAGAQAEIASQFAAARISLDEVINQDWSTSWRSLIKSVQVGKLWVGPPWDKKDAPADKIQIVIEPKMAFGTGDHPTTSLCLEAVDEFMAAHPGASVLDVGTGTGVLAIAAKKLGASRVEGTDNDAMSVVLAKENAEVNATPDVEFSEKELTAVKGEFDLVLANILANTLVELAPLIAPKVRGKLFLAGVLDHQREEVEAAYVKAGLKPAGWKAIREWVRLSFVPAR